LDISTKSKSGSSRASITRLEAARYALLRRLAPAIRHALVGRLHPIGLVSEAMARRMQSAPDAVQARESLEKIHELSRTAITTSADLLSWLAPEQGPAIGLKEGVEECLGLLGTDFSMRGHAIRAELEGADMTVAMPALRTVLAGVLVAQSDALARPSDLLFTAAREGETAVLMLAVKNARREDMPQPEESYRRLAWKEVQALAEAEGVELSRRGRSVELRMAILG
jgi:hypothetical protein